MIIFVTDGPWGFGKGSPLTAHEADLDLWDLDQRVTALETTPPTAVSIDHFTVSGNQLTIFLTNGTHSTFTIPSAQWRWTGPWRPFTHYFPLDLFSEGGGIWLVLVEHTTGATFDPLLFSGTGFVYTQLIAPPARPYDIAMHYAGLIPDDGSVLGETVLVRDVLFPKDLLQSEALLAVAATNDLLLDIQYNHTVVGHIHFSGSNVEIDGSQIGIFEFPNDVTFNRGSVVRVVAPSSSAGAADPTAKRLMVTFAVDVLEGSSG
jgi:hypothetical protein